MKNRMTVLEAKDKLTGGFTSILAGSRILDNSLSRKSRFGKSTAALQLAQYSKEYLKRFYPFKKLKGGNEIQMESKSRYQVIAELEDKKRKLILERDGFKDILKAKKKSIREMKREVEDEEEELKEYDSTIDERKETINELIKSIDESLGRFAELSKKQK